jgi:hypothetical protein
LRGSLGADFRKVMMRNETGNLK